MPEASPVPHGDLHRLPGLFRRWELAQLVVAGRDYRIEDAGTTNDGATLFAVYQSDPASPATTMDMEA